MMIIWQTCGNTLCAGLLMEQNVRFKSGWCMFTLELPKLCITLTPKFNHLHRLQRYVWNSYVHIKGMFFQKTKIRQCIYARRRQKNEDITWKKNITVCVFGLHSHVLLSCIWITHLAPRFISRLLKGRTRTATFTEEDDMMTTGQPTQHLKDKWNNVQNSQNWYFNIIHEPLITCWEIAYSIHQHFNPFLKLKNEKTYQEWIQKCWFTQ